MRAFPGIFHENKIIYTLEPTIIKIKKKKFAKINTIPHE